MTRINPAHVNPPRETTPEEAEANKRDMTRNEAAQRERESARNEAEHREQGGNLVPDPTREKAVDTPPPMPPD